MLYFKVSTRLQKTSDFLSNFIINSISIQFGDCKQFTVPNGFHLFHNWYSLDRRHRRNHNFVSEFLFLASPNQFRNEICEKNTFQFHFSNFIDDQDVRSGATFVNWSKKIIQRHGVNRIVSNFML